MLLTDTQLTASEVLKAFHHDEPYLFLGAAFTTVGVVSIGLCAIRRRFDPLLIWLAIFAHLYGQRLWLESNLLGLTVPDSEFFHRLRAAVDYLVPVPAFIFFHFAGFLGRQSKAITSVLVTIFMSLVVATCIFGPLDAFRWINNSVIVISLLGVGVWSLRQGSGDRDYVVFRGGLLCFVVLALFDNIIPSFRIEPYGFAVFLASLGYVAARRALQRDQELGEMKQELDLARRIQLSILPGEFPASTPFRVAARYVPMTTVAGDFYDFVGIDATQAGLFIADVSGHGIPAALIASMVKMAATSQSANAAHPARLLAGMNAALCGNTQGQYVTAAYVHLDAEAGEMRYAAAGHPAMLLLRSGNVTEIYENGLLLSASEDSVYTERTLGLEPGDRLLLYTDGLVEARNAQGQMFGEESLFDAMRNTAGLGVAETADRIIASVQQWAKLQDDDLTVLVCDYLGTV